MKLIIKCWIGIAVLIILSPLGLILPEHFKAGSAWGEWGIDGMQKLVGYVPGGLEKLSSLWNAPVPDYALKGWEEKGLPAEVILMNNEHTVMSFAFFYEEVFDRVPLEHLNRDRLLASLPKQRAFYDTTKRLFDMVMNSIEDDIAPAKPSGAVHSAPPSRPVCDRYYKFVFGEKRQSIRVSVL